MVIRCCRVRVAAGGFNLVLETLCIFTSNLIAYRAFGYQLSRFQRLRRSFGMPNEQVAVCVSYNKIKNKKRWRRRQKQTVNKFFIIFSLIWTFSALLSLALSHSVSCIVRKWYVKNANYKQLPLHALCVSIWWKCRWFALVSVLIVFAIDLFCWRQRSIAELMEFN